MESQPDSPQRAPSPVRLGRRPSNREVFEGSLSGAQVRPFIPRLRDDASPYHPLPRSIDEYRREEGEEAREKRLKALWRKARRHDEMFKHFDGTKVHVDSFEDMNDVTLNSETAQTLADMYEEELMRRCFNGNHGRASDLGLQEFQRYAEEKELELWHIFHDELDVDGNGHLDSEELMIALSNAGIELSASTLTDFMAVLTSSPHSKAISFPEFRDFLLLMPRKASTAEIYRYYEVRKFMGDDGRGGAARVTMEGDVSISAEDRPPIHSVIQSSQNASGSTYEEEEYDEYEEEEEHPHSTSLRFLLAGGIAGAVSRTCTAPFDRLKIFLITRPPDLGGGTLGEVAASPQTALRGMKAILGAVGRIYLEGGILAFWVGNGLSIAKIFPESAIKFFSYETSKRMFAKYVDKVDDSRDISGLSRFLSGGIGGISSQLSIYPIETLKTQMMSSTGDKQRTLTYSMKRLWNLGGLRAYYRGLTIGLVGVFPYAAIDMSTFEALKLAYLRSTGKDEPGVLPTLAFGSISGGVGATSVYPLNLVRTRLQASGSSGHPQRYTGILDVAVKTYEKEGWRGFYRGLFPTMAKVIPSVSISYVVYEYSKKKLGVY